jgi:flavin reductase (DIM6/NTAB) family NADH-FMN oxidoreductase RutF
VITLLTSSLTRPQTTALANGLVGPRPIAWVSTLAEDGTPNLAPFSYFNAFSSGPFTIGVGPGSREGANKDSLRNIKLSGEFTVSVVTEELAVRANLSSAEFDPSVNEWEIAGLSPRESVTVRPPSVAESPAGLECRVLTIVDLGEPELQTNSLIIARVTCIHVAEEVASAPDYRVDPDAIRLVARMGGDLWCTTRDRFSLRRPTIEQAHAGLSSIEIEPGAAVGVAEKGEQR